MLGIKRPPCCVSEDRLIQLFSKIGDAISTEWQKSSQVRCQSGNIITEELHVPVSLCLLYAGRMFFVGRCSEVLTISPKMPKLSTWHPASWLMSKNKVEMDGNGVISIRWQPFAPSNHSCKDSQHLQHWLNVVNNESFIYKTTCSRNIKALHLDISEVWCWNWNPFKTVISFLMTVSKIKNT